MRLLHSAAWAWLGLTPNISHDKIESPMQYLYSITGHLHHLPLSLSYDYCLLLGNYISRKRRHVQHDLGKLLTPRKAQSLRRGVEQFTEWKTNINHANYQSVLFSDSYNLVHSHWSRNVEARLSLVESFRVLLAPVKKVPEKIKSPEKCKKGSLTDT